MNAQPTGRSERTKRVLLSHPSAEMYGSDRMALETARILVDAGHEVYVVVPDDGKLVQAMRDAGAQVRVVSTPVIRKSALTVGGLMKLLFGVLVALPRILRLVRSLRPDLVYVNTIVQPWWILAGRVLGVPVVTHVREAERDAPRVVRAALLTPLGLSDRVLANSAATQRQVLADRPSLGGKTEVLYNGKDWSGYRVAPPPGGETLRVLFIGRLNPRKGPDIAIEALSILNSNGYSAVLDVAGAVFPGYEWYERQLRERVDELGVGDSVRFRGFVSDQPRLLEECDVLVVPSRVEPFGTVAAEGMAASRPVVVSDVQGLVEIVTHNETGIVVPPDDADALAQALQRLVDDPEQGARLAVCAAEDVRQRFSSERYAADIIRVAEREWARGGIA